MLSGAQLGITVTGLLAGYVAEPLIGSGIADLLGLASVPVGVGVAIGTAVSLIFCTVVQMLFGELFPKNLAIAIPESLARRLAVSTRWYLRLFGWLIWFMDQSSNVLLRALKIQPVHDVEQAATARDLEHIVAASSASGEMRRDLSTLLGRVLDFPTSTAEHAMIPRTRVDTVRFDETIDAVLTRMATGHTRYPVVGETTDEVLGVIDLHAVLDAEPTDTARSRCRPAVQVPTSLPLPITLNRLTEAGDELAVVIDEYGGLAGIVTVEDIAEELVGEIADEHDGADGRVIRTRRRLGASRRHPPRRGPATARRTPARRRLRDHRGVVDARVGPAARRRRQCRHRCCRTTPRLGPRSQRCCRPMFDPSNDACPPRCS